MTGYYDMTPSHMQCLPRMLMKMVHSATIGCYGYFPRNVDPNQCAHVRTLMNYHDMKIPKLWPLTYYRALQWKY